MRAPLWLKIGYTIWLIVWMSLYAVHYAPTHFLWMCHVGNLIVGIALWRDSGLLLSWQAVSLLVADLIFITDLLWRLILGWHLIGGTDYMFNGTLTLTLRLLALHHVAMPVLLIWALWHFGYDRRAFWLQLATCVVLYPLSYFLAPESEDVNWVRGPFGQIQHTVPPLAYLFATLILYPLVLYLPSHFLFMLVFPRPRTSVRATPAAVGT